MALQLGVSKILAKIMVFLGHPVIIFDLIHPNFGYFVDLTPTNSIEKVPWKNNAKLCQGNGSKTQNLVVCHIWAYTFWPPAGHNKVQIQKQSLSNAQ